MKILFILLTLGFCITTLAQTKISSDHLIVIAHRGNHTLAPENTLKAYEDGIKIGVDYVEIDLRTTKDGKLAIMHDENVDRMTTGKGNVKDLLWNELMKFKVLNKEHPEWGAYPIPTFTEVLNFCKGKVNIYLDFKDADVSVALKEIRAAGMESSIVVYINSIKQFHEWRAMAPNMPLMVSIPDNASADSFTEFLNQFDAEILDGSYLDYKIELVRIAHHAHKKIWADIQNKNEGPTMWEAALSLELDGLQTDHPSELIEFLIKKGLR